MCRPSREWKGLEQFVAAPRLSMAENSMSKMEIYMGEQEQKEPETIPIRGGRGFETKFYGASNLLKATAESSIMCTVCLTDALYLRGKALYLYTDGAIPCLSMHIHAYAPNELLCFHSLMQRSFRLIHAGFRH